MKIYIIGLMVSILIFTGCNDRERDVGNNENNTEIIDTSPSIDENETANNETVDENEPQLIDKRESIETMAREWYVRIVVEDTSNDMKTAAAQLGQLEAIDAVRQHTLKAIAPLRGTFLDVVFVNPAGVDVGSYKTNFHEAGTDESTWEFTVKSHDSNATMILGWRGLYVLTSYIDSENRERYTEYRSMTNPLLSYMTLLDIRNNIEIDVLSNDAVNEYVFNMDGATERTFRWKVKDSTSALPSKTKTLKHALSHKEKLQKLQIKALRKDVKATADGIKKKRLESLDMLSPPKFEVLVK